MKITKKQLNAIIIEEVQLARVERALLKEGPVGQAAAQAGLALLLEMVKSQDGRNRLSSIKLRVEC